MRKKITQNVNKDKFLNDLPKVNPLSSSWLSKHTNYQASRLGRIVPIYYEEILPGEHKAIRMAMTSHTQTPTAPIFPSLYTEIRAFFVPLRLCADLLNGYKTRKSPWVKVHGEDNASEDATIIVPLTEQKLPSFTEDHNFIGDVFNYADDHDYDDNILDSLDLFNPDADNEFYAKQNYLNLAAYELIYQTKYRNENYEAATNSELYRFLFDAYNPDKASSKLSASFDYEIANREKDYFTGMKPFTQKGDPVTLGVGDSAPVVFNKKKYPLNKILAPADAEHPLEEAFETLGNPGYYAVSDNDSDTPIRLKPGSYLTNTSYPVFSASSDRDYATFRDEDDATNYGTVYDPGKTLVADLSSAKGISVEELRMLIKTQELLEKDAIYGSKYAESLNAHFGCAPLDETLQEPAEIYKVTITSNMQAIFQTSSTSGEASILGTIGANSTTQTDPFVICPRTKFKEHGILMICAVHKLQNVYDTRFFKPKFNFKTQRFEFYTPELNDLGFQPVDGGKEFILASGKAGFNEAFAEYRYVFNKSHGSLNTEFPYWAPAISDEYTSAAAMYKEGTEILDKALSVRSDVAPQFFDAYGFEEMNHKPMTLHSIPGFDGVI